MADLDAARREAIRILCHAQASDQLSVDAFESRLDQVKHAPNQATLAAILADLEPAPLPVPLTTTSMPTAYGPRTDEVAPVSPAEFLRLASVFGSTARGGSWTVPLALEARVLFGEMTIDLRDAVFGSDVVDIEVDVALGSFTLIVPAGTQVENEVMETLSSSTHSVRNARGARPNGLLVRLQGKALLASVDVKEKYPTGQGKPKGMLQRLLGGGD